MSDDDLIDEFDVFPDAPNSKPVILHLFTFQTPIFI